MEYNRFTPSHVVLALLVSTLTLSCSDPLSAVGWKPYTVHSDRSDVFLAAIDPANHVPVDERYELVKLDTPKPRPALYERRDFEEVEQILNEYRQMPQSDWPSPLYSYALSRLADIEDELDPEQQREILDDWCRESDSHLPWLVRGAFNCQDAFRFRGEGWASEVPEEAWPKFHERIEWMESDLLHAAELDPADAEIFVYLIYADTYKSNPREEMEEHFAAATALAPAHYRAWYAKLWYLLPRWHGTHEEARKHVTEASAMAEAYPWLYQVGLDYAEIVAQEAGEFDWSDPDFYGWVQSTFEQRLADHPESVYLKQSYALFAYRAKDWATTVRLMDEVGDQYAEGSGWQSLESYNRYRALACIKLSGNADVPRKQVLELALRGLTLAPDYDQVVFEAASRMRWVTNDFETSVKLAEHALRLNPEHVPSYWLLAVDLLNTGRADEAVAAAETGLKYAQSDHYKQLLNDILRVARSRAG